MGMCSVVLFYTYDLRLLTFGHLILLAFIHSQSSRWPAGPYTICTHCPQPLPPLLFSCSSPLEPCWSLPFLKHTVHPGLWAFALSTLFPLSGMCPSPPYVCITTLLIFKSLLKPHLPLRSILTHYVILPLLPQSNPLNPNPFMLLFKFFLCTYHLLIEFMVLFIFNP